MSLRKSQDINHWSWPVALMSVLLPGLFLFSSASALEFNCTIAGDERVLLVEIPGEENLCEVSVTSQSGERKVVWYANNDTQFCTTKAYELREKYINEWNFNCETQLDLDGIDLLSGRHRLILDTELKRMITAGNTASPPYFVESVRATSNLNNDASPSTLALQYFLSTGDVTQVIVDDGQNWKVMANIDELITQIESDVKITAALVESITDTGALQILTVVENTIAEDTCFGSQILVAESDTQLVARTPHSYSCEP